MIRNSYIHREICGSNRSPPGLYWGVLGAAADINITTGFTEKFRSVTERLFFGIERYLIAKRCKAAQIDATKSTNATHQKYKKLPLQNKFVLLVVCFVLFVV
jgi:hypothetical protein